MSNYFTIFVVALKLGLMSFGGPTAHLGYFYDEYVKKKKWLSEKEYSDLVALCQFLPGPASSQVGIGIGTIRGGMIGGICSFIGFTLPSVIILMLFALVFINSTSEFSWIQGLKIVAVAIVAQAIWGMGKKLANTRTTVTLALFVLLLSLLVDNVFIQVIALTLTGIYGAIFLKSDLEAHTAKKEKIFLISKTKGLISFVLFFSLLFILPILSSITNNVWVKMIDSFYRAGALVFGGGHVVLPLLEKEFVPQNFVSPDQFITGYAAAQGVPGPLFTFASYLGTSIEGVLGGIIATIAIFLPAFLLLFGVLPFWDHIKSNSYVDAFLKGISAGVVGILIAAFYNPIWTSTIENELDFILASVLFILLIFYKLPSWFIVILGLIFGIVLY